MLYSRIGPDRRWLGPVGLLFLFCVVLPVAILLTGCSDAKTVTVPNGPQATAPFESIDGWEIGQMLNDTWMFTSPNNIFADENRCLWLIADRGVCFDPPDHKSFLAIHKTAKGDYNVIVYGPLNFPLHPNAKHFRPVIGVSKIIMRDKPKQIENPKDLFKE